MFQQKSLKKLSKFLKKNLKKLRLIDYVAILLLITVAGFFLFRLKRVSDSVYVELTFQRDWSSDLNPPEYWEVNKIKVNDSVLNSLGEPVGEVIEVKSTPWEGGSQLQYKILVRLNSLKTLSPGTYSFEGSPIYIGADITLNTNREQFSGTIMNIFNNPEQRYKDFKKADAVVKVKAREYEKWVVEEMGDFELGNGSGEILAEVIGLESNPAEEAESNSQGILVLTEHPYLKDMEITFKLYDVLCQNTLCYFNDFFTFMVGQEFWIENGSVYIGPRTSIMSVEIIEKD